MTPREKPPADGERFADLVGVAAFAAGVPGPFHGLFNIDLALLVAFAVSAVVLVGVSVTDRSSRLVSQAR